MFRAYTDQSELNAYPGSILLTLEDGYDPMLISKVNQQMTALFDEHIVDKTTERADLVESMTTMLEKFGERTTHITSKELYESHPMMVFGECKEPMCFMSRCTYPGIRLMVEDLFSKHLTQQLDTDAETNRFKIGIHGVGGFLTELLIISNALNEFEQNDGTITELHLTGDKFDEFIGYFNMEINGDKAKIFSLDQIEFDNMDKTNYYRVKFFIMIRIIEWFKNIGHTVQIYLHTEDSIVQQRAKFDAFMSIDYVDQFIAHQINSGYTIANACVKQGGLVMLARTGGLMQQPQIVIDIRQKEKNIDDAEVAYDYVMIEKNKELDEQMNQIAQNTEHYVHAHVFEPHKSKESHFMMDNSDDESYSAPLLCKINHPKPTMLTLAELKECADPPQDIKIRSNQMIFARIPSGQVVDFLIKTTPTVKDLETKKREIEAEIMKIAHDYYDEAFEPLVQYDGFFKVSMVAFTYVWARMTREQKIQHICNVPVRIAHGLVGAFKELSITVMNPILNRLGYYRHDDMKQFSRWPKVNLSKEESDSDELFGELSDNVIDMTPIMENSQKNEESEKLE
jgi:hypothetical protein